MSLKRLIESFDCVAGDCKETRFSDDIPAMQELEAALHAAADALKRVRRTRMCDYRDAFQQTIEDRYPDAAWYEVAPIDLGVTLYGGVDNAITEILEAVKPEFRDGNMPEKKEDKEPCREDLGGDVADYQRWVDYDMKRYGRISDKTQQDIDKAGLSVVKDQYGEYEVIAKEADSDAKHEDLDKLKKVAPDLEMETEKPVEGKEKLKKVAPDLEMESCNNSLKEELSEDEEKAKALSDELGKEVDFHNGIFETNDGEEYEVLTDDEADERFSEGVRELIDEMGIEAFSPNFQEWIKDNALDSEWFDEAKDESNEFYMQDIQEESDYEYSSRLLREMVEEGVVEESDLEEDEDGLLDLKEGSVDDYWEDFKERLNDRWPDSVQWYVDNFGNEDLTTVIKNNSGILDVDKIVEEVKDIDGRGNELASYDGEEIELDNGYFAYRVN